MGHPILDYAETLQMAQVLASQPLGQSFSRYADDYLNSIIAELHAGATADGVPRRFLCGFGIFSEAEGGERFYELHGFETDVEDLAGQAEDVLLVVFAVGVVGDAAAFVGGDLVLIDDPFEGGAVAETIFVGSGGNAGEGQELESEQRTRLVGLRPDLARVRMGRFPTARAVG